MSDKLAQALRDLLDAHARNVLYNGGHCWDHARAALAEHDAAQKAESGWISVVDRMPDPGEDVLCYRRGPWTAPPPIVAGLHRGEWFVFGGDEPIVCITHWMPLPAAPKQENQHD